MLSGVRGYQASRGPGGVLLLAVTWACCVQAAPPGYTDAAACAACHRQISESFSKTGMGRSFRSVGAAGRIAELESGSYNHAASGDRFTASRRGDAYYIGRTTVGADGKPDNLFEARVDYVVGSGERAVSYLHRTRDNQLVEMPISWYGQKGGFWAMSPAYDRPDHAGFGRTITYRCMFCHNAYPDVAGGVGNWDGATIFPEKLPEGIDCQRCHGPGAGHVTAAGAGRPASEIRAAIVNPSRLAPERQMEVCMQCHLETTSAQLPGAMMRFGRDVFSYRPGEPLADYQLYFDHAPGSGHDDKFEFVSTVYRLRKSACFNGSAGKLTCTTCHDPHRQPSREEALRTTNRACAGCHESAVAALVSKGRHPAAADCAECHMPLRQGVDAIHITITDHKIQRPGKSPAPAPTVEAHDGNTLPYAGEVAPYYPAAGDPLYTALAQVNGFANLRVGLASLEKLLADSRPPMAGPYLALAEAFFQTSQAERAIPFYEQAVRLEPENWRALFGVAQALQATGKVTQAVTALERAVALAPDETTLLHGLGIDYSLAGRSADAVRTLREVVSRNPEDASAQVNLGQALLRANDLGSAETAIREAVRLRPESASLRVNLAEALMQYGQLRDAAFQLEAAIKIGPSGELAHSAWYAALAANGSVAGAQARYDDSLHRQVSELHDNLGTTRLMLHDPDGAIREYRMAADADSQSAAAALNLGLTLAGRAQSEESRHWLEVALRLDPELTAAHLKLGELLLAAGQLPEAVAHLKLAAASPDPRLRAAAEKLLEKNR